MFRPLYFLATFAEAGLSVFGIRSYEQPAYTVTRKLGDAVELRAYPQRVAAETTMDDGADGEAFERLFRYITGANAGATAMKMTAPVQQAPVQQEPVAPGPGVQASGKQGRMLAMTVPVELAGGQGARCMRFFLPKEASAHPPSPTDPKVRIVALPAGNFAALRFSGTLSAASRQQAAARLHAELSQAGIKEIGPPSILSYDPPFTIPFLRRNEVAIPIAMP